jgi:hypothetical protein
LKRNKTPAFNKEAIKKEKTETYEFLFSKLTTIHQANCPVIGKFLV